ncbi:hypothetical protein BVC80_1835g37 [Macleaya cordata]|uniref:Glycoside hydrolase n=1 Tax=Macleaya cordata TaxID=56857 RepID=A0A200R4P5_MACCD|nr:hypothetical protein BVC80_1835g37 [Macleaya cordata]
MGSVRLSGIQDGDDVTRVLVNTEIVRSMTTIVSGLQGVPLEGHHYGYPYIAGKDNIIACAKHFVGDGGQN